MKGMIFTSFLDFAEKYFGADFVDDMLDSSNLSTEGAYTNVGTYPAQELFEMIDFIKSHHDVNIPEMTHSFGQHAFDVLVTRYGKLVQEYNTCFECIYHVDQTIHKNVLKLYPDAELPYMNARISDMGERLTLEYRSTHPLMHLAHGLIQGCINHYGEDIELQMADLSNGEGTHADFVLTRNG